MMFVGKIAIITGAGSQIAKRIADEISKNHRIIKHKLHPDDDFFNGDLSVEENVIRFFSEFETGSLHTVICCAGGIKINGVRPNPEDCLSISDINARGLFDCNFFSTLFVCKHAIPKMALVSNIIVIGSAVVSKPRMNGEVGIYACAKAAVHEYVLHLANQLKDTGIKINCIATDGHDLELVAKTVSEMLNSKSSGEIVRLEKC